MDAITPDKQTIIDRLTEAAKPSSTGELYIRAGTACRIIGVGPGQQTNWEKRGQIKAKRYRVPVQRNATIGVVVAWPLDQVIAAIRARRTRFERSWSAADEDKLLNWLGRYSIDTIAEKLGRTVNATRTRAMILGVNSRTNTGALTTGQVAGLCRRTRQAVQLWCLEQGSHGLKFTRIPGPKGEKLIKPEDLFAFLQAHPLIWNRLSKASNRMIERMAIDVKAPTRKRDTSEPEPKIYRTPGRAA